MQNDLILLTYPFVIFTSLITAGIVTYASANTSSSKLTLWWFMVGVAIVAVALAIENLLFMYGRMGGKDLYTYISNSSILYGIKITYGFGMWVHFCAAFSAISGVNMSLKMIFRGLIVWVVSYTILVLAYFNM